MVTIPYATNPNIQAQQRLFTVVRRPLAEERVDQQSLDEIISDYVCRLPDNTSENSSEDEPIFLRFELPWCEFDSLLTLLANSGINGSTVFPGYKGAADTVKEMRWWDAR